MEPSKRPLAVILTQVLICFFAVVSPLSDIFLVFPSLASEIMAEPTIVGRLRLTAWPVGRFIFELTFYSITFYGLQKRKAYGWLLAIAGLVILFLLGLHSITMILLQLLRQSPPIADPEIDVAMLPRFIFFMAGIVTLLLWLLFSANVRRFLSLGKSINTNVNPG